MAHPSKYDLDRMMSDILELREGRRLTAAKDVVREFLDESVFRYFCEQPYSAQLRDPLKPRFEGNIKHRPTVALSADVGDADAIG